MENLARYVDKEENTSVELIISAHLLERITHIANTGNRALEERDMYEQFGFLRDAIGEQSLTLFVPDNTVDSTQYTRGGPCRIVEARVIGDFQSLADPKAANWDAATGLVMKKTQNANGYLFTYRFATPLPDGYYQYQYVVRFENSTVRIIDDPCTKYGGDSQDRSAFVVGGTPVEPVGLDNRCLRKT